MVNMNMFDAGGEVIFRKKLLNWPQNLVNPVAGRLICLKMSDQLLIDQQIFWQKTLRQKFQLVLLPLRLSGQSDSSRCHCQLQLESKYCSLKSDALKILFLYYCRCTATGVQSLKPDTQYAAGYILQPNQPCIESLPNSKYTRECYILSGKYCNHPTILQWGWWNSARGDIVRYFPSARRIISTCQENIFHLPEEWYSPARELFLTCQETLSSVSDTASTLTDLGGPEGTNEKGMMNDKTNKNNGSNENSNKLSQIKLTLFCSGCRHGVAWGTNANTVDTHNLRAGAVL